MNRATEMKYYVVLNIRNTTGINKIMNSEQLKLRRTINHSPLNVATGT